VEGVIETDRLRYNSRQDNNSLPLSFSSYASDTCTTPEPPRLPPRGWRPKAEALVHGDRESAGSSTFSSTLPPACTIPPFGRWRVPVTSGGPEVDAAVAEKNGVCRRLRPAERKTCLERRVAADRARARQHSGAATIITLDTTQQPRRRRRRERRDDLPERLDAGHHVRRGWAMRRDLDSSTAGPCRAHARRGHRATPDLQHSRRYEDNGCPPPAAAPSVTVMRPRRIEQPHAGVVLPRTAWRHRADRVTGKSCGESNGCASRSSSRRS